MSSSIYFVLILKHALGYDLSKLYELPCMNPQDFRKKNFLRYHVFSYVANPKTSITFDEKHLDSNVIAFWKGLGTNNLKK